MKNLFGYLIGPTLLILWVATNWSPILWIFNTIIAIALIIFVLASLGLDTASPRQLNKTLVEYRKVSTFQWTYTLVYQIGVMFFMYSYDLRKSLILFGLTFVVYCWFKSAVHSLDRASRI